MKSVRNFLVVGLMAVGIGACVTASQISSFIQQAKTIAATTCGFQPLATAAVDALLQQLAPQYANASEFGAALCDGLEVKASASRGGDGPVSAQTRLRGRVIPGVVRRPAAR